MKLTSIKKGLLATAAAGVLAVGMAGEAQAFPPGSNAFANLMVKDFTITFSSSDAGFGVGGVNISNEGNIGVTHRGISDDPDGPTGQTNINGDIVVAKACEGAGCVHANAANDVFVMPVPDTEDLSQADVSVTGSGLNPGGASVSHVAQTGLNSTGAGVADAESGTNSRASFTVMATDLGVGETFSTFDLTLTLDVSVFLDVTAGTDPVSDFLARAEVDLGMTLTANGLDVDSNDDIRMVWNLGSTSITEALDESLAATGTDASPGTPTNPFNVDEEFVEISTGGGSLDKTINSDLAPCDTVGDAAYDGTDDTYCTFTVTIFDLPVNEAGITYALDIDGSANTLATVEIPEPGTLGLLGASLVALGVARRRIAK